MKKRAMNIEGYVIVVCVALLGCTEKDNDKGSSWGQALATTAVTDSLPGLQVNVWSSADQQCQEFSQVSVAEWVAAADAIVIGTVAEVLLPDKAYVNISGYDGPKVIPVEQCREEHREMLAGFRVRLTDVVSITGDVPTTIEVPFGQRDRGALEMDARPFVRDQEIVWSDESKSIRPGMRIGGALYWVEDPGLYTFRTARLQAFFMEEAGRILFQPYVGEWIPCGRLIPPINELGGQETAAVIQALVAQEALTTAEQRERSTLRSALGYDGVSMKVPFSEVLPGCTPEDWEAPEEVPCTDDSDCPPGVLCSHFHDRSVCDHVEPPEGEPCTDHSDCPEGSVCVDYIDLKVCQEM